MIIIVLMPVQQNSFTHLRVLLVLPDCGIWNTYKRGRTISNINYGAFTAHLEGHKKALHTSPVQHLFEPGSISN
jgi:hypothetical protein